MNNGGTKYVKDAVNPTARVKPKTTPRLPAINETNATSGIKKATPSILLAPRILIKEKILVLPVMLAIVIAAKPPRDMAVISMESICVKAKPVVISGMLLVIMFVASSRVMTITFSGN